MLNSRYLLKFTCFALLIFQLVAISETATADTIPFSESERKYLVDSFVSESFDKVFLEEIFLDEQLDKYPVVVNKNIHNKENRRNYDDFNSAYSFKIANRFSQKWRNVLKKASEKFDVDQEVLIAILLVESGLGNVLGKFPVISVFSSILVEYHLKSNEFKDLNELTSDQSYVLERLSIKAEWAYRELTALLTIVQTTNQSAFRFRGSYAGAFGIPQFLPSSYVKWGVDSDENGTVNLFLFPDAIYSTANYLKAHGWKKGLYLESNKDVIYRYNHSDIYVETVLNIAKKIKASQSSIIDQSEQTRLNRSRKSRIKESTS